MTPLQEKLNKIGTLFGEEVYMRNLDERMKAMVNKFFQRASGIVMLNEDVEREIEAYFKNQETRLITALRERVEGMKKPVIGAMDGEAINYNQIISDVIQKLES